MSTLLTNNSQVMEHFTAAVDQKTISKVIVGDTEYTDIAFSGLNVIEFNDGANNIMYEDLGSGYGLYINQDFSSETRIQIIDDDIKITPLPDILLPQYYTVVLEKKGGQKAYIVKSLYYPIVVAQAVKLGMMITSVTPHYFKPTVGAYDVLVEYADVTVTDWTLVS